MSIFRTATPLVEGPYTDEYGSFVRALAPVVDPRSGDVIMVVGIHQEAGEWQAALERERLGMILPIALLVLALVAGGLLMRRRERLNAQGRTRMRYLEAYLIGIFGLILTFLLAQAAHQAERREQVEAFRQLADSKVQILLTAFSSLEKDQLGSLVQLFESSEYVTREEFATFAAPMVSRAAIQAMGWAPAVPREEKAEWEAAAKDEGYLDVVYQLTDDRRVPVDAREVYYPVWYLEPVGGNESGFGFDIGSEEARRAALEAAITNGSPTATDLIELVVLEEALNSLAVYSHVISGDGGTQQGIAMAVVNLDPFLQSALSFSISDDPPVLVEFYQLESGREPLFLASSSTEHSAFHLEQNESLEVHEPVIEGLSSIYPLFAFNKTYALLVQADEAFLASYPLQSLWTTLLTGTLFTALIGVVLLFVSARRADLEDQVYTRTTELEESRESLLRAYDATIEGWSHALELRDEETEGHTQRVVRLTERLARAMGIGEEELAHIRRGAMLHDIGKIGIPDKILRKRGKLNETEWEAVRRHPGFAYEMLSSIEYLKPALDIPRCHHEKWDGSGYPRGLKGKRIPLAARIFAVVDVFDALTSDRPYREAWSTTKALRYIEEQRGKHFDPEAVEVFFSEIVATGRV